MAIKLLRTKPLSLLMADTESAEHKLRRALTAWDLTALGIGLSIFFSYDLRKSKLAKTQISREK